MDVDELIRTMRSVRTFTPEPLAEADLEAILDAGRRAQSSNNSQPWTFIVVRDRDTLRALSECGRYAGHLAGATVAIALVANVQLAAWGRGIGSCIASMWQPDTAKAILGVPAERQFDAAISFGWPSPEELGRTRQKGARRPLSSWTSARRSAARHISWCPAPPRRPPP